METPEENGGSFPVDVNENEEAGCKPYVLLKDRNILAKSRPAEDNRCPASEDGGQEAGKGHVYAASNGRNVNKEGCALAQLSPALHHGNAIMLDLVAAEKCLPGSLKDSCVISDLCDDHSSLNGFTDSLVQERIMVGLDHGEGGGGLVGSGRGTVSCPAVLEEGNGMLLPLDRVSQTDRQLGQDCARESGEIPDSNDVQPGDKASGGESSIWHIPTTPSELSCTGKHQRNCTCTDFSVSDMKMSNGDIDSQTYSDPDADVAYCKQAEALSVQLPCQGFGFCDVEGKEVKVANGGLHIVNTRATCDHSESDYFSENKTNVPFDVVVVHGCNRQPQDEKRLNVGLGSATLCERSQSNISEGQARGCPWEGAPAAAELSHSLTAALDLAERFPSSETSAKLHSPCPSTLSNLTSDSPLTEPCIREDEECNDFSLPARPLSLRTNPNIAFSLSCDATPLSPEDRGFYFGTEGYTDDIRNAFEAGRRQSAPDNLPDAAEQNDSSEQKLMPKRFGIADFFTRSLFSRKPKEPKAPSHNATGWRLFGKAAARENDAITTQQDDSPDSALEADSDPGLLPTGEEQGKGPGAASCPQRPLSVGRRRNLEFEPLSTTGLILEDRPANLPAKSQEEALRHKQEYEEMVAGAKRRELKEAQRKKRLIKERHRQEESIARAMVIWINDILPHWDTMKGTRRVRDLWWQGLPPSVRGRVWSLAIGNELNITPELYEIFLSRAKEKWRSYSETSSVNDSESDCGASLADRESSLDLIKLDISRTFPSLFIFQKGGPYHDLLHSVLGAYTCYRPDIGYVQGMSFIAAVLILNLEEADAFITFANLLNKPCQMAFFRVDHELMLKYFAAFEVFFEENLPRLFSHFLTNNLTPDLYLIDWIFTLYSKSLPLDVACRVWDVFCRDGEESLFRTGLGILRLYEDVLLQMDFIHIAQFLTRLPDDLPAHTLFTAMANTHMISGNRRWAQVFSALMKDGNKEMDKNNSPALRS